MKVGNETKFQGIILHLIRPQRAGFEFSCKEYKFSCPIILVAAQTQCIDHRQESVLPLNRNRVAPFRETNEERQNT